MRKAPKDGSTRFENVATQPLKHHRVFNNPLVISEGWYPVCSSTTLRTEKASSFKLASQRIVVYRTKSGRVVAMDAFCPHMGADLGNGRVVGENIQCYFHQFELSAEGQLVKVPCKELPEGVENQTWPVEEKYGYIWVYSAPEAPYPVPSPPGLESRQIDTWNVLNVTLFAHHHVMMVGGVDLLHFSTVHGIDVDFDVEIDEQEQTALWKLNGLVPRKGWRAHLLHLLVESRINYHALVAGGSFITLTYGPKMKWRITKKPATFYIVWGCVPLPTGVSEVKVFLVSERKSGFFGWLRSKFQLLLTFLLLVVLKDDDQKAFPYMRFNIGRLVQEDGCAARMLRFINSQKISVWSKGEKVKT